MRINLKWNLRLFISMFLVLAALLILGFSAFAAAAPSATPQPGNTDLQPVLVPVILDGVRYEPADFNKIYSQLYAKGVDLIFAVNPGDGNFYAFTTNAGYNDFAKKNGLPVYIKPNSK